MLVCENCGKVNPNGTKFCGECGTSLEKHIEKVEVKPETAEVEETKPEIKLEANCWRIFGRVGFGLGLAGLICAASIIASSVALLLCGYGFVFSILGMVSKIKVNKKKALSGIILSVFGFGIGLLFFYITLKVLDSRLRYYGIRISDFFKFAKLFMLKVSI